MLACSSADQRAALKPPQLLAACCARSAWLAGAAIKWLWAQRRSCSFAAAPHRRCRTQLAYA